MRRRPIELNCLVTISLVALLAAGCGRVAQNDNGNQNRNTAVNVNRNTAVTADNTAGATDGGIDAASLAALVSECNEPQLDDRVTRVQLKLQSLVAADTGPTGMAGRVKFQATKINNRYIELLVEGQTVTPGNMDLKLFRFLKAVFKDGCVERVVFVPPGEIIARKTVEGLVFDGGFVWGCEAPAELCPNGECRDPAQCPNPMVNTNTNTNTNTNSGNRNRP